jgi:FMN reductase (NADPH)
MDPLGTRDEALLARLFAHRTVRRFADVEVPDRDVELAVRAAQRAATSHMIQGYSLIRVRSVETRRALSLVAGDQAHVREAGAFFAVVADQHRHRMVAKRAGAPHVANFEAFLVCVIDAALFAQNLVVAFESLGYGICYVGGLRNDAEEVDRLLGTPAGAFVLFGLCVGVPAERPAPLPRLPVEAVLFEERYPAEDALARPIALHDADMARWHEEVRKKRGRDWSGQMLRIFGRAQRPHLARHYRVKGASFD